VKWRARAGDGTEWGPWSSSGGQGFCEFVYDNERPEKPTISAPGLPDDGMWHGGVGDHEEFTFSGPSEDTAAYRYSFDGQGWEIVRPEVLGASVIVRWAPDSEGTHWVEVQALDRAANNSGNATHFFRIGEGREPAGHWTLEDAEHAPGSAGAGVSFDVTGPSRTEAVGAVRLDGTAEAFLTGEHVIDSTEPFAVSAWVRPATLGRDMTAVGQDSDTHDPFSLGLSAGTGDPAWSLALPTVDGTMQLKGGHPVADRWNHLAGVYDPVTRTAELFVNGVSVAVAEGVTAQQTGALQIGRVDGAANWSGALADVRVWDRLVFEDRLADLAHREPVRTGYWQFNEADNGRSAEYEGGQDFVLGGDAHIPPPNCAPDDIFCTPEAVVGSSSLYLDGSGDHATTAEPVIDSDGSFTLAARVRLDANPTRDMTVLSLPGEHTNALDLRYSADSHKWEVAVTDTDATGAEVTTVSSWAYSEFASYGDHLAVTYDASTGALKLYVNAQLTLSASIETDTWSADGGLQIGRALTPDGWDRHLVGVVDEVRSYIGVLPESDIGRLPLLAEYPQL
jgi:hypothetical protein